MHALFLCWRYLQKRRLALCGMAAVGLCVALLIIITSLFTGFIHAFERYADQAFGQICLYPPGRIARGSELAQRITALDNVRVARPVLAFGGLLYLGKGDVRAVQVIGTDLDTLADEPFFRDNLVFPEPATPAQKLVLSENAREKAAAWLQRRLRREPTAEELPAPAVLGVGIMGQIDEATDEYDIPALRRQLTEHKQVLHLTTGSFAGDEGQQSAQKEQIICWPTALVQTGVHEIDSSQMFLPYDYVAQVIGQRSESGEALTAAAIHIFAPPGVDAHDTIESVREVWRDYALNDMQWPLSWVELVEIEVSADSYRVQRFTAEIRKQLGIWQAIIGFVCLVVALLIFIIFYMIIAQKRRDVGIVRSVGGSGWSVVVTFLGYGASIGLIGSLLGLLLGWQVTDHLNTLEAALSHALGFKIWRGGAYLFNEIPHEMAWSAVGGIMLMGILTAMLGAIGPAIKAARMSPIDALRYE